MISWLIGPAMPQIPYTEDFMGELIIITRFIRKLPADLYCTVAFFGHFLRHIIPFRIQNILRSPTRLMIISTHNSSILSMGGVFWTVDFKGEKLDERKQVYAQAFFLYALSEYYRAVKRQFVLELAIQLFRWIEAHAYDQKRKGYYEAFDRDWSWIEDQRLSPKDLNEQKTMNTHLHLLEAYSNLYGVWKNAGLRNQIENLLEVFAHHFIDDRSRHLHLFFDVEWNLKSELISYGHEIEAAWLLQQAAETVRHPGWTVTMKSLATKIAEAASEGLDQEGGMNYECEKNKVIRDKHWWPQAEAMVGFYNAYQVSGEERWLKKSIASWQFVKNHLKDNSKGEWFWGVDERNAIMQGYDKAGLWKCPYHNGRACMELIRRIEPLAVLKR